MANSHHLLGGPSFFLFHSFALKKITMTLCIYSSSEVSLHMLGTQGPDLAETDAQRLGDESARGGRTRKGSLPKPGKEVRKTGYCPTQSNSVS